jgi:transcriptional regulator with XRE-family HTH domain
MAAIMPIAFDTVGVYADQLASAPSYLQPLANGRAFIGFGSAGTGGLESIRSSYLDHPGYKLFVLIVTYEDAHTPDEPSFADGMRQIKSGFGRTMSSLTEVFGVSRQTLYNWLNGETPKEQHQAKLIQLAAAAHVFATKGVKPTSRMLARSLLHGKSFLQLIADGSQGPEAAERLIKLEQRSNKARTALAEVLGDRKASRPVVSDVGAPFFNEDT